MGLRIRKLTKFKGDTPKRAKILLHKGAKFDIPLFGGGTKLHPTTQTSVKFRDLAELYLELVSFQKIIFKLGNFTDFKAFFPEVLTDFPSQNHGRVSVLLLTSIVLLPRENKLILSYFYPQRIANCGYIIVLF